MYFIAYKLEEYWFEGYNFIYDRYERFKYWYFGIEIISCQNFQQQKMCFSLIWMVIYIQNLQKVEWQQK